MMRGTGRAVSLCVGLVCLHQSPPQISHTLPGSKSFIIVHLGFVNHVDFGVAEIELVSLVLVAKISPLDCFVLVHL